MAQSNSTPAPASEPDVIDAPRPEARRRAAAYVDLWERQLADTAARGPGAATATRRGATTGP